MKKLRDLLKQDFTALDSIINRLLLIGFIGLYSAFFIGIYKPFNINLWGIGFYFEYVILGIIVIITSQLILRPFFGFKTFKLYSLLCWGVFEMLIMALVFYFVYSPVYDNWGDRIYDYLDTVRLVGLVAIVPYAIVVLYLGFNKRLSALKDAEKNTRNSFSGKENKLLTIRGENEKVILAIEYHQLLYIKSAGNYLELFYLKGDKQAKELVRTRLKELEKS